MTTVQLSVLIAVIFVSVAESLNYCHTSNIHSSIRKCCIQHKNCPIVLEMDATKYNLKNNLSYHLYYCKCEQSFFNCLSHVKSGRAVATRKAHFLDDTSQQTRKCLHLEESRVCVKKLLGLFCNQHSNVLRGSIENVENFL